MYLRKLWGGSPQNGGKGAKVEGQGLGYHREGSDLHGDDIREPWGRSEPERDLHGEEAGWSLGERRAGPGQMNQVNWG